MYYLRGNFAEQFADFSMAGTIYIGDKGATHFDNISAECVN